MGALVNVDGDGSMSTKNANRDEIAASEPVVYQLVRINGDGTLVPATDDELIEFEHFVEDESKLFYTDCETRQSNNMEIGSKEFVSKEHMDADGPFIQPNLSDAYAKMQLTEPDIETGNKEARKVGEGSVPETFSSLRPDFSLLKGEICLDNFSVRELQEAFRATFGRYTSIKDKLWLKRRIAMGLTNSSNVPSSNFFIKDNKIVLRNVIEETNRELSNLSDSGLITMNKATVLSKESLKEALVDSTIQVEELQVLPSRGSDKLFEGSNEENVNAQIEQRGIKRIRKPTKRYIEELSEVEATECSGRSTSWDKTSVQDQYFFKSRMRTSMIGTSKDLLGGFDSRIPCVHRGRRRRPRKNFLALMNFVHLEGDKKCTEASDGERLSSQEQHGIHENPHIVRTVVASVRRKHHRAWTLTEVLKLVEGVSRYGAGKWSEIRRSAFTSGSHRTSVDLKDKWRNLLKASFAEVPTDKGIVVPRKPTSLPIPTAVLIRVRELAEKHSQSGVELGSGQFIGHGVSVQEKESGFL